MIYKTKYDLLEFWRSNYIAENWPLSPGDNLILLLKVENLSSKVVLRIDQNP